MVQSRGYGMRARVQRPELELVCFYILKIFLKKFNFLFFYFKLIFLNHFDALISKIIFLK